MSALILDVDGTLAPIVARPELAEVPEETRAELRRLAETLPPRRVRERPRGVGRRGRLVDVPGIEVVGNHGLELDPARSRARRRTSPPSAPRSRCPSRTSGSRSRTTTARPRTRRPPEPSSSSVARARRGRGARPALGPQGARDPPAVDADKGTAVRTLLARVGRARAGSTRATTRPTSTPSKACAPPASSTRSASRSIPSRHRPGLREAADSRRPRLRPGWPSSLRRL